MKLVESVPNCINCGACCVALFDGFEKSGLSEVNEDKIFKYFKKGEEIFAENSTPRGLYLVFSGSVKITKSDNEGKELTVRLAKRGNVFGYRALICSDMYRASSYALEDSYICFIPKEQYYRLLIHQPHIFQQLVKALTKDLQLAETMMFSLALKHVRSRIAGIIFRLESFYGVYEKEKTINTELKKEEIGHLAGTTTETAIRILSDFKKSGIIEMVGKRIRILDRNKLDKIFLEK